MTEPDALVGVVPTPQTTFQRAAGTVSEALSEVRLTLTARREQRDALNAEIRQLVADEDLLRRMARLAERPSTNGDADEPG